jgi:hypothetical protein
VFLIANIFLCQNDVFESVKDRANFGWGPQELSHRRVLTGFE